MTRTDVNLTEQVSGVLPAANGGTGQNSLTGLPLTGPQIDAVKGTNGNSALVINDNSGAVNWFRIDNNGAGIGPAINAVGSDTNIDFLLCPRGTGRLEIFMVTSGATPTIYGASVDTNCDLILQANGTGVPKATTGVVLNLTQGGNALIPAGYGQYFPDTMEIVSGIGFEIGAGAVVEIG